MKTTEIFRELNKKGYKHYYGGTIEELDSMDKNNPDLHSEIMQVVMWLYEKHGIWISIYPHGQLENKWMYLLYKVNNDITEDTSIPYKEYNSPTEAYSEAIKEILKNLIK